MIGYQAVNMYGVERYDLSFYNCIFDEENEEYNINKPHKHKVVKAWNLKCPGYIYDGISYEQENGHIVTGCRYENFE